jgi:murein DD-endopeptidase MepM/ murein hydrolase activator NlpD
MPEEPDMTLHTLTRNLAVNASKCLLVGACSGLLLALQACTTVDGTIPSPKYPIYMQDKPAEATETVGQAGDDKPVVTPATSHGAIETTDLAPPPPPPPPASTTGVKASASASAAPAAPVRDTRAAYVYVLQAHDTLYGVSRRFGVPVKDLYDINGLSPDASLRIGQKVLLPASAVDKGVEEHANGPTMVKLAAVLTKPTAPVTTPTAKPVVKPVVAPPATTPTTVPAVTPATKPVVAPPAPAANGFPTNAQIAQMGRGRFVWPVRGKLLVPFGQLAPNVRNDGINIGAYSGTEIKAAADGTVVYEGNEVKELGNTVYIKHPDGWYTGYSHLATMTVKNNEKVTKGQIIGTVGQTGTIDQPQLHFEIRYTPSAELAKPIDPALVLP